MNNEELKKKIVEVVLNSEITGIQIRAITGGYSMANNIADALIAAGIGDVKETEYHMKVMEKKYKIALINYAKLHRKETRYNKITATYDAEITEQAQKELKGKCKK